MRYSKAPRHSAWDAILGAWPWEKDLLVLTWIARDSIIVFHVLSPQQTQTCNACRYFCWLIWMDDRFKHVMTWHHLALRYQQAGEVALVLFGACVLVMCLSSPADSLESINPDSHIKNQRLRSSILNKIDDGSHGLFEGIEREVLFQLVSL